MEYNLAIGSKEVFSFPSFFIGITLSYFLSYLVGRVYINASRTLSNREAFARIFPLLSSATCLIIFVVKSSLALSLGLVGALSIVRFRTAIKDPEELVYLFVCIGIGLASGAEQYLAAIFGFVLIMAGAYFLKLKQIKMSPKNCLRFSVKSINSSDISELIELVSIHSSRVDLSSLSLGKVGSNESSLNLNLIVEDFSNLERLRSTIQNRYPDAIFTFIEVQSI